MYINLFMLLFLSDPPFRSNNNSAETGVDPVYNHLVNNILTNGVARGDRTGTGTLSIFGAQLRFSLRDNKFPLLTTKRVFFRGVVEELLWFIRGSTNAKELQARDVHIWDKNSSREYLDLIGLYNRTEGDLGAVYGFLWRHYGADYVNCNTDYTGQGIDQLLNIIELIKNRPEDRRLLMCVWSPKDLSGAALPPCCVMIQFYVSQSELSCQVYQRSADIGLGLPFNIASYALLTCLIAHVTGLRPGDLVHTLGDAHIYSTHEKQLKLQIQRQPRSCPKLFIKGDVQNILDFTSENFTIVGYDPHPTLEMPMAV